MIYSETESGLPVITNTFAPSSTADLGEQICGIIDASGYWTVTGSSGDRYALSVANDDGYLAKIRMYATASSYLDCALYDPAGSAWNLYDAPATRMRHYYRAGATYRVIASPYWFFALNETTIEVYSTMYCGVLKMPPKAAETITDCAVLCGWAGGQNESWRTSQRWSQHQHAINSSRDGSDRSYLNVAVPYVYYYSSGVQPLPPYWDTPGMERIHDCEIAVSETYGSTALHTIGFAYDMIMWNKSFAASSVESLGGIDFYCITHNINPSIFVIMGAMP